MRCYGGRMAETPPDDQPPLNESLRATLGAVRVVRKLASSPRSRVWLVEFDGAPGIVKQITAGRDAEERYAREIAALGLAARAEPPVVPRVLGTDPDSLVMVLEYLASEPPAEDWPIGYAQALARLHATTTADDSHLLPRHRGPSPADVDAFLALARYLDVPIPQRIPERLQQLCARLSDGGGHALLHGDPCPGNDLHSGDGVRFVDLEQAAFGDGMTELAYLRIGFPTCWCVTDTPTALRHDAELAYREQWRAETGTEPSGDLAAACVGWLIQGDALVERALRESTDQLARVTHDDWSWGTTTARGRLLYRTAVVAGLGGEDREDDGDGGLAEVSALCQSLHGSMRRHWPEAAKRLVPTKRDFTS